MTLSKKNNNKMYLNCDLGETESITPASVEHYVMPHINMANIACGGHAGNEETIAQTIRLAKSHNVIIGAHPSYPDKKNFGRLSLKISKQDLLDSLKEQLTRFMHVARVEQYLPQYVKPHGALYNDLVKDSAIAKTVLKTVADTNFANPDSILKLMVLSSAPAFVVQLAEKYSVELIFEAFADRRYLANGQLTPRFLEDGSKNPQAQLHFLDALQQIQLLKAHSGVIDDQGLPVKVLATSICVHGDNPQAASEMELLKLSLNSELNLDILTPTSFIFRLAPNSKLSLVQLKNELDNQFNESLHVSTVSFDSLLIESNLAQEDIKKMLYNAFCLAKNLLTEHQNQKVNNIKLPIYYGDEVSLDMPHIVKSSGLSKQQIIDLHLNSTYDVGAIGFAPGFAYLKGLPKQLQLPRHKTPRASLPAGSVAIAEDMTAIYPQSSPGGWNIIGQCPLPLFDPLNDKCPIPYKTGDTVSFYEVDLAEFKKLKAQYSGSGSGSGSANHADINKPVQTQNKSENSDNIQNPVLRVIKSGALSTMQDSGRHQVSQFGIGTSGAIDKTAFYWANKLLGNNRSDPCIEITLGNAEFECLIDGFVCITGAEVKCLLDNKSIPQWQVIPVSAGQRIKLGYAKTGLRVYLAVAGGFLSESAFGSVSTCIREQLGTVLKNKDILVATTPPTKTSNDNASDVGLRKISKNIRSLSFKHVPHYQKQLELKVVTSSHAFELEVENSKLLASFFGTTFQVSADSDRMGVRLQPIDSAEPNNDKLNNNELKHTLSISPEGIQLGAIQITPDGMPIIMMVDRQTLGGYPKIGTLSPEDINKLAQARPGTHIRFKATSISAQ
ncbi:hypothetical protein GCM10009128_06390 [Psychrosphaera haliotis]|uniref:5-oxoprolinase subunit PxpA n=1 Tax=Psychrosphaera haliotis TaxID=555083 RepID=UPI0031E37843